MTTRDTDRGAAALIVAGALVFLFGMAAMAVDTSGFYQTARVGQTTADLACLAGVAELPDESAAIEMAADYTKANWYAMRAAGAPVITGDEGVLSDGNGNVVIFEVDYDGDPEVMRVRVTEQSPTTFGRVLGTDSVNVTEEAFCRATVSYDGTGGLPMGVLPGGFAGDLFGPNPCDSGNCGGLRFGGNGANVFKDNIINGIPRQLGKHHGPVGEPDPDTNELPLHCEDVENGEKCHRTRTESGLNTGKLREGIMTRLKNTSVASDTCDIHDPPNSGTIDCDNPPTILGGAPTRISEMGAPPDGWDDSLHGDWPSEAENHWWYNGSGVKCDSPRLARVPIVSSDLNWKLGDSNPGWDKQVKFIGFLDVIIVDMTDWAVVDEGEGGGKGKGKGKGGGGGDGIDKSVTAIVIWYGPNAACEDGTPLTSVNPAHGPTKPTVKLVSP